MKRARRLTSLAAVALVGSLALTGCRAQPGAAIYLGATTYSEQYVNGLADQLQKMPSFSRADSRQTIAQWLLERDLGKRLVADKKWTEPKVDEQAATAAVQDGLQQAGAQSGAQPSIASLRPFIQLFAQYSAYRGAVQQHVTPAQISDAEYAEVYQRTKAAGEVPPGVDVASYRKLLSPDNQRALQLTLGLRNLYAEALKGTDASLNPKYGPAELVLLRDQKNNPVVALPLNAKGATTVVVPAPVVQSEAPSNG
jgi:hypothetical protein